MNEQKKTLIPSPDQFKFYSGDCYIFQYNYPGEDKEEVLIGTWFGKKSIKVMTLFIIKNIFLSVIYNYALTSGFVISAV